MEEYSLELIRGVNNKVVHNYQIQSHTMNVDRHTIETYDYYDAIGDLIDFDNVSLIDLDYYETWLTYNK